MRGYTARQRQSQQSSSPGKPLPTLSLQNAPLQEGLAREKQVEQVATITN